MKFYVINKPSGSYAVEADKIENVTYKSADEAPFMIVAADRVAEGEIYQAIQIKPTTVQLNFKTGHRMVEASSIKEALGGKVVTVVDVTEAIANIITSEKPTLTGGYTPTGKFVAVGNDVEVSYNDASVLSGTAVMDDLARFLGSLHDEGIDKVTADNKEYTWDTTGTLKGSNFKDASGKTLVSVIVATMKNELVSTGSASGTLTVNGKDMTYSVNVELPKTEPSNEENKDTEEVTE